MIASKLREVLIAIKGGRVTLDYPLGPGHPVPEKFRGRMEIDIEKCIGCGGCANVCPSRCIVLSDLAQDRRVIEVYRDRCIYCARCQEVCPEGAITLTQEFEMSTDTRDDVTDSVDIFMATCQRCGRCFKPMTVLDRMMTTGFVSRPERPLPEGEV